MMDPRVLDKAVADGVIDAGQAERLAAIARDIGPADAGSRDTGPRDPEDMRFVRGFGDIFVTIGIALVLGPVVYLSGRQFGGDGVVISGIVVALSWLLAEYFTRVRRMALPSIALLTVFTVATGLFFLNLLDPEAAGTLRGVWSLGFRPAQPPEQGFGSVQVVLAALLTALAVAAYYVRFRVPIAIGAGAAALVALALSLVGTIAPAFAEANFLWLLLVAGVLVFLLAMRFDTSDPERLTRRSDVAFWLHLLAAPLIVHPILWSVLGGRDAVDGGSAVLILALFAAIAALSLVIDRRSFLVAGLSYAGIAFSTLLSDTLAIETVGSASALIVGVLVLSLSAGWPLLRSALLPLVPSPLARQLPPITRP